MNFRGLMLSRAFIKTWLLGTVLASGPSTYVSCLLYHRPCAHISIRSFVLWRSRRPRMCAGPTSSSCLFPTSNSLCLIASRRLARHLLPAAPAPSECRSETDLGLFRPTLCGICHRLHAFILWPFMIVAGIIFNEQFFDCPPHS